MRCFSSVGTRETDVVAANVLASSADRALRAKRRRQELPAPGRCRQGTPRGKKAPSPAGRRRLRLVVGATLLVGLEEAARGGRRRDTRTPADRCSRWILDGPARCVEAPSLAGSSACCSTSWKSCSCTTRRRKARAASSTCFPSSSPDRGCASTCFLGIRDDALAQLDVLQGKDPRPLRKLAATRSPRPAKPRGRRSSGRSSAITR